MWNALLRAWEIIEAVEENREMSHRRVVLAALVVTYATALRVATPTTRRAALGLGFTAAASFASPRAASARVTEYANQMLNIVKPNMLPAPGRPKRDNSRLRRLQNRALCRCKAILRTKPH